MIIIMNLLLLSNNSHNMLLLCVYSYSFRVSCSGTSKYWYKRDNIQGVNKFELCLRFFFSLRSPPNDVFLVINSAHGNYSYILLRYMISIWFIYTYCDYYWYIIMILLYGGVDCMVPHIPQIRLVAWSLKTYLSQPSPPKKKCINNPPNTAVDFSRNYMRSGFSVCIDKITDCAQENTF